MMADDNMFLLKAVYDGKICGFICLFIQETPRNGYVHSKIGYIYNFGVDEMCRGPVSYTHLDVYKRQLWGTTRAQINSLVKGVSAGYSKSIELNGVGYKARMDGKNLVLTLGFSHDVPFETPKGITIVCESQTTLKVSGVDKQLVGQVAAEIRKYRQPAPYKGKGIRVDGERCV